MEPCCALKYYPAVDACQSEKVLISITQSIKIDKITLLKANPPLLSTAKENALELLITPLVSSFLCFIIVCTLPLAGRGHGNKAASG